MDGESVVQLCNRVTVYNSILILSYMVICSLFLAVKVSKELVVEPRRSIVESKFFVYPINLFQIGGFELEVATKIGSDTGWGLGFWNDRVTVVDAPRQCYLCARLVVLLSNLHKS